MRMRGTLGVWLCWVLLTTAQAAPTKFVLWLHGMNSDENAWRDTEVGVPLGETPVIFGGAMVPGVFSSAQNIFASRDLFGVYHVRVRFGSEEQIHGAIPGLLGDLPTQWTTRGDFSTFDTLAGELALAIKRISRDMAGQDFTVALVCHSRGGLVARALLQTPKYAQEGSRVIGLVTIGTPHSGSEFGRIHQYLARTIVNGRAPDPSPPSWKWVAWLSTAVNLKAPIIGFLAPDSREIRRLAAGASRLPGNVLYGALVYTGVPFGVLRQGSVEVNPFKGLYIHGFKLLSALESKARAFLLRGKTTSQLAGDGIVPEERQKFPKTVNANTTVIHSRHVLHTDETGREMDILTKLRETVPWWSH